MEVTGKIIAVMPVKTGQSARGEWQAQEFVVEVPGQYPKKICFEIFGSEFIMKFNVEVGKDVRVLFDIDAREYNGRWFNSLKAFNILNLNVENTAPNGAQSAAPQSSMDDPFSAPASESSQQGKLPF